jgi:hypothetical protein
MAPILAARDSRDTAHASLEAALTAAATRAETLCRA